MTSSTSQSPLDRTFARLRLLTPYVDGRVAVAEPAVAQPLDGARLEALLAAVGTARGTADERVRVMLGLHGSVFYRVMPALGAFLAEDRVPCLEPACTDVVWDGSDTPGTVTVCGRFVMAADEREAVDTLHASLAAAVRPVVSALAARGPLRARVLWLSASDTVAGGLLWLGELLGAEARAAAVAVELLRRPGSPFVSPRAEVRTYRAADASRTVHVRATCCLSWRLRDGSWCSTCPVVDERERERLVLAGIGVA